MWKDDPWDYGNDSLFFPCGGEESMRGGKQKSVTLTVGIKLSAVLTLSEICVRAPASDGDKGTEKPMSSNVK